jgi:hypothetical protein
MRAPSAGSQALPQGAETLADKAERCRRLAAGISDRQAADVLRGMALQYENSAARLKS